MILDAIKEKLAIEIFQSEAWEEMLEETNPGHYGILDWDVDISSDHISVDILAKKFMFKNVTISFSLQLGSSNSQDGFESSFSRISKGKGNFELEDENLYIKDLELDFNLDLYDDEYEGEYDE
jgi:hypothetical protein